MSSIWRELAGDVEPSMRLRTNAPATADSQSSEELRKMTEIAARAQQDLDSVRKRVQRELTDLEIKVTAQLVVDLVPVLDDFERALNADGVTPDDPPEDDHVLYGVCLLFRRLLAVLEGYGVTSYVPVGERFDPHRHEAMMSETGSDAPNVLRVINRGYELNGRVLRPSRVIVG